MTGNSFSHYAENLVLSALLLGVAFTPPPAVYLALLSAAPTNDDNVSSLEITGGGYVRIAALFEPPAVNSYGIDGFNTGSYTKNSNTLVYPAPTSDWGSIAGFAIYDALTGGNCLIHGTLSSPVDFGVGSGFTLSPNSITIYLD